MKIICSALILIMIFVMIIAPLKTATYTTKFDEPVIVYPVAPDAPADFAINSIYIFADQDRNTGRKGIGNEYYFDITKAMISTYAADGKGTLHRNGYRFG